MVKLRSYFVLVNPYGGKKKAAHIFKNYLEPELIKRQYKYEVYYTIKQNHARSIVFCLNINLWDGIIIVSGDGLIHEVINGLMDRDDWEQAIKIPLGIIPGGTGNALHTALCHQYGKYDRSTFIRDCVRHALDGNPKPLDIFKISTQASSLTSRERVPPVDRVYYSILGLSWGLIADVDHESEVHRYLGRLRYLIHGLRRIKNLRHYSGSFYYRTSGTSSPIYLTDEQIRLDKKIKSVPTRTETNADNGTEIINNNIGEFSPQIGCCSYKTSGSSRIYKFQDEERNVMELSDGNESSFPTAPHSSFPILKEVVALYVCNLSHISQDFSVTPGAKINDGYAHLCILKGGIPKSHMLKFLFNLSDITSMEQKFVHTVPVTYFGMHPHSFNTNANKSIPLLKFVSISKKSKSLRDASSTDRLSPTSAPKFSVFHVNVLLKNCLLKVVSLHRAFLRGLAAKFDNRDMLKPAKFFSSGKGKIIIDNNVNNRSPVCPITMIINPSSIHRDISNNTNNNCNDANQNIPQNLLLKSVLQIGQIGDSNLMDEDNSAKDLQFVVNGSESHNILTNPNAPIVQPFSIMTIDGETLPCCSVTLEVLPSLARLFTL